MQILGILVFKILSYLVQSQTLQDKDWFSEKNHSFISYGVAHIQLQYNTNAAERLGSTSLMYIPVDKRFFYLSSSEMENMCSKIRCLRLVEVSSM